MKCLIVCLMLMLVTACAGTQDHWYRTTAHVVGSPQAFEAFQERCFANNKKVVIVRKRASEPSAGTVKLTRCYKTILK